MSTISLGSQPRNFSQHERSFWDGDVQPTHFILVKRESKSTSNQNDKNKMSKYIQYIYTFTYSCMNGYLVRWEVITRNNDFRNINI